ncbi:MAG: alpha/beta hydrolase [Gaiella sp.]|nr:alpha/beta hydrolase [Gaiella sp.]
MEKAVSALDALELVGADLCGLSWGSLVALRFAIDRPERVSRLVLAAGFASPSRSRPRVLPKARFEMIPRAGHIANLDNPDGFNRAVAAFLGEAAAT